MNGKRSEAEFDAEGADVVGAGVRVSFALGVDVDDDEAEASLEEDSVDDLPFAGEGLVSSSVGFEGEEPLSLDLLFFFKMGLGAGSEGGEAMVYKSGN